jgi:hypothetical protein
MRVFGTDGIGWKTAIAVEVGAALVATYFLARHLFGIRVALVTLGVLVTSHYLLAYVHTGYPNLQPLFPAVLSLLFLGLGIRHGSPILLALAGAAAGLGWYTYYTSRAAIVVLGIVIALQVHPRAWLRFGLPAVAGFLALVVPMFVATGSDLVARMLEQSGAGTSTEPVRDRAMLPLLNLGRSLMAYNYTRHDGPYVWGSLAEPVTAAFFVLGLGYAIATWRDARARTVLAYFAVGILVTGILSKYDYVSVSRLHYLIPIVAILAALAIDRALRVVATSVPPVANGVVVAGAVAIIGLASASNLHRWFVETPSRVPTSSDTVVIRLLQSDSCNHATDDPLIIDRGIGGRLGPALEAIGQIRQPRVILYEDESWIATAPTRCVLFRNPEDPPAKAAISAVQERWPNANPQIETDRSGKTKIAVFYPLITSGG